MNYRPRIFAPLVALVVFGASFVSVAHAANCDSTKLGKSVYGQSGPSVRALQECFLSIGYSLPSGVTGYYGAQTRAAVTKFYAKELGVSNWDGKSMGPKGRVKLYEKFLNKAKTPIVATGAQKSIPESGALIKNTDGKYALDADLFAKLLGAQYEVTITKEGAQLGYGIAHAAKFDLLNRGLLGAEPVFRQSSIGIIDAARADVVKKFLALEFVVEKYSIKDVPAGRTLVSKDGDEKIMWLTDSLIDFVMLDVEEGVPGAPEAVAALQKLFPPSTAKFQQYLGHVDYSAPGVTFLGDATTRDLKDFQNREIGSYVLGSINASTQGLPSKYLHFNIGTYVSTTTGAKGTMEVYSVTTMRDVAESFYQRASSLTPISSEGNSHASIYKDASGTFCFQPNRIVSFPGMSPDGLFIKKVMEADPSLCMMAAGEFMKYYGY